MQNIVVTKQNIVTGLKNLGLKASDTALVHSSLSRFGNVIGGVDAVIDALLEAVAPNGTIMVPTLTGSEKLCAANPPFFDVKYSPCWTGKIPETFRKRDAAIRSLHPTHSVAAIGAKAEYFTAGHDTSITPCGLNSPYYKLALSEGYVLMLGVGLECCTLFHTAEELADVDYVNQKDFVNATVKDYQDKELKLKLKIHKYGDERNFPKMESIFIEKGILKKGKIGNAEIRLIKAGEFLNFTVRMLKQNPKILVSKH
ncbi:MAG: AAC(3) family N-acetyltransferase [Phycisphaerales bacterium]